MLCIRLYLTRSQLNFGVRQRRAFLTTSSLIRQLLHLWPNKSPWEMGLLTVQLGGGGVFVLYQFVWRVSHVGTDSAAWVLLVGGVIMLILLRLSWTDYRSRRSRNRERDR
jgi:hypothetical protein